MILPPGHVVAERFRIEAPIGRGGMARVYRATQLNLGKPVAVKVLLPEFSVQANARERFGREAKVAAALRHPNAVHVFDYGEEEGAFFLVMELLEGATLQDLLDDRGGSLGVTAAVDICHDVADVLVAAHTLPLVHRDLKPANIFIDSGHLGGRVRVMDFGLAFIAHGEGEDVGRLTEEGLGMGTPDYISPEQAMCAAIGPPADIYGLGCVFFEMITGRTPFVGSAVEMVTAHCYRTAPRLAEACELDIPAVVEELVGRMLAKLPEARPNAAAVRLRLASLKAGDPGESVPIVSGRDARMVAAAPVIDAGAERGQHTVAVIGAISESLTTGLAANGLHCQPGMTGGDAVAAILVVDGEPAQVAALMAHELPVIVGSAGGIEAVAKLMNGGAAEVCTLPLRSEDVARKVERAIRKHRKRRSSGGSS